MTESHSAHLLRAPAVPSSALDTAASSTTKLSEFLPVPVWTTLFGRLCCVLDHCDQIFHTPERLCQASGHGRCAADRLMDADEVVPDGVERNHVVVRQAALGEGVGQASEAAHLHPHGEVLALNVAGADVRRIGSPLNAGLLDARTFGRAVAARWVRRLAVELNELRIIHSRAESPSTASRYAL